MAPTATEAVFELYHRTPGQPDQLLDRVKFYPFKSIVVALGGKGSVPQDPPTPDMGVFQIALTLYANGWDVHMYDENEVDKQGKGDAYDETVEAIQQREVSHVAAVGFSHGGGSVYNLTKRLEDNSGAGKQITKPYTVTYTAYLDAIRNDGFNPSASEIRHPKASQYHVNLYQKAAFLAGLLHGEPVPGSVVNANLFEQLKRLNGGNQILHPQFDEQPLVKSTTVDHMINPNKANLPK